MLTTLQSLFLDFSESQMPAALLVAGGESSSSNNNVYLVEMRDNVTCPGLPDFPQSFLENVGIILDGKLVLCPGSCYYYLDTENRWLRQDSLLASRDGASGILLNSSTWWISGGATSKSTEIRNADGSTRMYYVNTTYERNFHSVLRFNETHFIFAGGSTNEGYAELYDITSETWTTLPSLPEFNEDFQSGLILFPDGKRKLVVVGGSDVNFCYGLDFETMQWDFLPTLPKQIYNATSVQYDTNFIIVGGRDQDDSRLDSMFVYDIENEYWKQLPQTLSETYSRVTAFFLPDGFLCQTT